MSELRYSASSPMPMMLPVKVARDTLHARIERVVCESPSQYTHSLMQQIRNTSNAMLSAKLETDKDVWTMHTRVRLCASFSGSRRYFNELWLQDKVSAQLLATATPHELLSTCAYNLLQFPEPVCLELLLTYGDVKCAV